MKAVCVFLIVLTALAHAGYGEAIRVLPELVAPSFLDSDGDSLFVLDQYTVYVYSLENFSLVKSFGKQGEGPGELMTQPDLPITMMVHGDQVILNSFNKMVRFSNTGEFVDEKKIPFILSQMIPFGDHYAVTKFSRLPDGSSKVGVLLLDESLDTVKTIFEASLLNDQGRGRIAYPLLTVFIRVAGGRLYVHNQQEGLRIRVFNRDGNQVGEIEHAYEKIITDAEYKKTKMAWLLRQPAVRRAPEEIIKKWIYFLDELPALVHFTVKEGRIYAQTSRTRAGGSESEFFILDLTGKILDKRFLPNAKPETIRINPAANYTFTGDGYYYLRETEDEEWELCVEKLK